MIREMDKQCFWGNEAEDSLRAFAISLYRYASQDPSILLQFAKTAKDQEDIRYWERLYHLLQNKDALTDFVRMTHKIAKDCDWASIEDTYRNWGSCGWITDQSLVEFGFWDYCPLSQIEADKLVLKNLKKQYLLQIIGEISENTQRPEVFEEAYACFTNKYYHACASLLISLIDGELISSKVNSVLSNRKTGAIAGMRVIADVAKDENYGEPGLFRLELLNYNAFVDTLFEKAAGFRKEPNHINRNYLHHGMGKRKVLRKDCIKLFLAYRRTLCYSMHYVGKG